MWRVLGLWRGVGLRIGLCLREMMRSKGCLCNAHKPDSTSAMRGFPISPVSTARRFLVVSKVCVRPLPGEYHQSSLYAVTAGRGQIKSAEFTP